MNRILLASTATLTLLLAGCAVSSPEVEATRAATPPPAPTALPIPTEIVETPVSDEANAMKDVWEDATPEQQTWALQQIEAAAAEGDPTTAIVKRAAEMGFTVTPEAVDEFLAWLATQPTN